MTSCKRRSNFGIYKNQGKDVGIRQASNEDFVKLVKELDKYASSVPKFEHVDTYILPQYGNTILRGSLAGPQTIPVHYRL